MFVYMLLLPEEQTEETWKTSEKQIPCGNQEALDRKVLSIGIRKGNDTLTEAELYTELC